MPDTHPPPSPLRAWLVVLVATLAMSVSYMDRQALAAIAPTVREVLHISHERFGWLASGFAFAYLACAPLAGWLVDRVGARRALAIAVLAWSVVAALHALASSFFALLVLRVLLGAAESPSFPAAARTVQGALPVHRRSAGMGLLFTGSSIGAMVVAPLAVRLAKTHGFRFAFVGTALVGLAWLPMWLAFAPRDRGTVAALPAGPRSPLGPVLAHPATWRQAVIVAASAPALSLVITWLPQYLVEETKISKDDVGHYVWLPPLIFDAAAIAFGALASRRDAKRPGASHAGLMLAAGAMLTVLAALPLAGGPWTVAVLAGVAMGGGAGMYVLGTADLMRRVPPEMIATAGGVSAAVQSIAQIVSSPIVGAVIDRTHAWGGVLLALGAFSLPGAVAWSLMPVARDPRA